MEQCERIQIENKKLRKENQTLRCNQINVNQYKLWNTNDILLWILNNLFQQEIAGHDLSQINELDIDGFGIINDEDKKYLMQQMIYYQEEGV